MRDAGEQEATVSAAESPAEFLENLGKVLLNMEGVDLALAEIVATHLLTATPVGDSVATAKDAILKLANARATAQDSEMADG